MQLRDYQITNAKLACYILNNLGLVYIAAQVRTGKTLMALETARLYGAKRVLFITKKMAVPSILNDHTNFGYKYHLTVTNNESIHKLDSYEYDVVISDEHHRNGAFPKPNKSTKFIKEKFSDIPMIFLSGTPTPESYSQYYHQFWVSDRSPFTETNFYKWANKYVDIKEKYVSYGKCKDYSNANIELIKPLIDQYIVTYTQKEAGFTTEVKENVLYCRMKDSTYNMCSTLKKDKVIQGKTEVILADTAVKLMGKLHQMYSGTVKFESDNSMVFDDTKARFIKEYFAGKKIAIFYIFKEELNVLKSIYGNEITTDLEEFNTTSKNIALQIVSGREGISLKEADYIVYYNIAFSALSYWQSRDRLTTMDRKENQVYWVFSQFGIEEKIYKSVLNKKDFTLSVFKKEYGIKTSKQSNKGLGSERVLRDQTNQNELQWNPGLTGT